MSLLTRIKNLVLRKLLPKLYDGAFLARWARGPVLAQAMRAEKFLHYEPDPDLLGPPVTDNPDPVRYAVLALAARRVQTLQVPGDIAAVGVYRGHTSKILRHCAPERNLLLFDSFEGFERSEADIRFRDTSEELVKGVIGDTDRVTLVKGFVPGTFKGFEDRRFALVVLDVDKYQPTRDSLDFFLPRLSPGGYLFLHDYNNPESDWGVKRAVDEVMKGRPEPLVDIPDRWGTLLLCKPSSAFSP